MDLSSFLVPWFAAHGGALTVLLVVALLRRKFFGA